MAIVDYPGLTLCLVSDGFPDRDDGWHLSHIDTGDQYIRVAGTWETRGLGYSFAPPTKSGIATTNALGRAGVRFGTPFVDDAYTVALTCTYDGSSALAMVDTKVAAGFSMRTFDPATGNAKGDVIVSWLATRNYNE